MLASDEWQNACRSRDFARIFRLVKLKAGVYPSRIAALCGMTPSRVGEIMAGRRTPAHIDVIERVADGLRVPGAMLGSPWTVHRMSPLPFADAQSQHGTRTKRGRAGYATRIRPVRRV
ncbi:helix-turn-helix domain-containing protein [Streptomyces javensis]|uniref:helix-turn-helix domain-containing protein n=1 Tax=Streptomyces javensis TaxID=114698 RepID=UPI003F4CF4B3